MAVEQVLGSATAALPTHQASLTRRDDVAPDSLFPGGVGNTFGDAEAFRSLIDDVSTKLFDRLPDETWFYPGHGDDSVLGNERPHLQEWRERGW